MMKMIGRYLSLGLMAAMLMEVAMAANYTVGVPGGGWSPSTNLQAWASSISFLQGDFLIFRFTTNHDVTEVLESDFESCRANPQQRFTGGSAVVPLTSAGTRYFICGTAGHCSIFGMKVAITVAASSPPPSSTTASSPPPPSSTIASSPPPPSSTTASSPPPSSTAAVP